jgi:hypothetical protein
LGPSGQLAPERFLALTREAHRARTRIQEAAYQELHRDPYRPELAPSLLSLVPADLEALNEDVVTAACERLGLHVEEQPGRGAFSVDFGNEALVDSLPGVPGGRGFLGTFERQLAVEDETLDFFAAGHPLVEGLLAHLEESPLGRVAALHIAVGSERGMGVAAFYKDGPAFEVVVEDLEGRPRPTWVDVLRHRPLRTRRVPPERLRAPGFEAAVQRIAGRLDPARRPVAVAAVFVGA